MLLVEGSVQTAEKQSKVLIYPTRDKLLVVPVDMNIIKSHPERIQLEAFQLL